MVHPAANVLPVEHRCNTQQIKALIYFKMHMWERLSLQIVATKNIHLIARYTAFYSRSTLYVCSNEKNEHWRVNFLALPDIFPSAYNLQFFIDNDMIQSD